MNILPRQVLQLLRTLIRSDNSSTTVSAFNNLRRMRWFDPATLSSLLLWTLNRKAACLLFCMLNRKADFFLSSFDNLQVAIKRSRLWRQWTNRWSEPMNARINHAASSSVIPTVRPRDFYHIYTASSSAESSSKSTMIDFLFFYDSR
jgi:hypothetical protein